jgi:hypothetical protein
MLRLIDQDLSEATKNHLASLQKQIDDVPAFEEKVRLAGSLWDNKTSSKAGKAAFAEIKSKLIAMCVGKELCNYCEQNEASDIEHIAPKSLFPHLAFVWSNYLLACKHCNTGYKLDAMYIFLLPNTPEAAYVKRGTQPTSNEIAFLQPRLENPMDLMELHITDIDFPRDFEFYAAKQHLPGTRNHEKVIRTLEILGMDEQRSLQRLRSHAFTNFKNRLREYVSVSKATTFDEIDQATVDDPKSDPAKPFAQEQQRILQAIQADILTADHPTVWQEMIRQRALLPAKIQQHFAQVPELIAATVRP